MLTGSVGVNGGGLGHYVGQEKLVNAASWASIAFGLDWGMAPRHQNTPSFHYVHSDQWRYERGYRDYDALPQLRRRLGYAVRGNVLFPHLTARDNITLAKPLKPQVINVLSSSPIRISGHRVDRT